MCSTCATGATSDPHVLGGQLVRLPVPRAKTLFFVTMVRRSIGYLADSHVPRTASPRFLARSRVWSVTCAFNRVSSSVWIPLSISCL